MKLSASRSLPSRHRTVLVTSCCLLAALLCSSGLVWAAAKPRTRSNNRPPDFTILAPAFGSAQTGKVEVKLQYVTNHEDPTIHVQLNGRAMNERRFTKSCQGAKCTVTGQLTRWDGLRMGENNLSATLTGRLHQPTSLTASSSTPVLLESTKFDYFQGLSSGQGYNTLAYYTPVSIGLSTLPTGGGAQGTPWLQLTTGYPVDWNSSADAYAFPNLPGIDPTTNQPITLTTITVPYPDVTEGFPCTGATFQAYVLGRQNPYLAGPNDQYVETGACFNTISEFQSFFQSKMNRALGSQDLVIMGTAPGQTVPPGFDATPLGGNNYSTFPPSVYPQSYVMIGVPGALAGTGYESFNIPAAANHPDTSYQPSLNGTLMLDQNNNYNFVASGDTSFAVHSDSNTGSSYIQVGSNTYTPPASNGNNFWVLVLDRETLTPVNYYLSPDAFQNCDTSTANQSCGAAYAVEADGGTKLATELSSFPAHNLIFLVSQGCPVANDSTIGPNLDRALNFLGGAPYAVNTMSTGTSGTYQCNYSLVSVYDGVHEHALTDNVALSVGGAFASNGQYGSVHGFLARNNQGLYDIAGKDQMTPNSEGTGWASPVDYTFQQVTSNQRQDWPLVDSGWPVEAYADISYQILNALGETGSRLYDVRYFYTSSDFLTKPGLGNIILSNLGTVTYQAASPFTQQSWDNATPDQFTAARQQIGTELQQAISAYGYLSLVRGQMAGSDSTIYADMIGMASVISKDYSQASNADANTKFSNVTNLLAGVAGIGSAIPGIGPIFGIVNGALTIGSAAVALGNSTPSPEAVFDTSLGNFTADATTYIRNLESGFDGAVDNILSDAGKLSTIGALTSNSDSTWNFPNSLSQDQLQNPLVDAAARSIWLDVIPQLFGIRYYDGGPSNNPGDYGVFDDNTRVCVSVYQDVDPASWGAYHSIGSAGTQYDLYVFAESPKASSFDTAVSKTLADLLTTPGSQTINSNLQDNLNLPPMLLYGSSNMVYSAFQAPAIFASYPVVDCK